MKWIAEFTTRNMHDRHSVVAMVELTRWEVYTVDLLRGV